MRVLKFSEPRRGDVFFADLNPVVGAEQGGVRPVLVLQNDTGNRRGPTVIVAAITSREKPRLPTHVEVFVTGLERAVVLLEQIRTIDKKRLRELRGRLSIEDMRRVEMALLVSLGMGRERACV
ncbi:MAG: type II toxin-antitoxin system PemK/MazF family toxin [Thermaerobacter sp.]|jgi:mRNA interferase MazF|nr:type II toxin-antitoxin system PemK/MazF family toxin [Thermaerobacter sp.]